MRYKIESTIEAHPKEVFNALHQYKQSRRPADLFRDVLPPKIVGVHFQVITDNTLGLGAVYDWHFRILGIPILKFQEKVVEWTEGKSVAYQAISGWKMFFRTELEPVPEGTLLETEIDFSPFGTAVLDWLAYPIVKWGLSRVYQRLEKTIRRVDVERKSSVGSN